MAPVQTGTRNYAEDDRRRLARAVIAAREAAGYPSRPKFVAAKKELNAKSLDLVERAEPGVGPKFLRALARSLPDWSEDTPWAILEGSEPPQPRTGETNVSSPPEKQGGSTGPIDLSRVAPHLRREMVRQTIRGLELFKESEDVYTQYVDLAIDLAIQLGQLEEAERSGAMGESVRQVG